MVKKEAQLFKEQLMVKKEALKKVEYHFVNLHIMYSWHASHIEYRIYQIMYALSLSYIILMQCAFFSFISLHLVSLLSYYKKDKVHI